MMIFQPDRYLLKKQIKEAANHLGGKILDVGAGEIRRYMSLFKFSEYVTVDIDPKFKPDIIAPADKLPVDENSFDSIICTQVLEHAKNPMAVVAEFYRVLKPGGVCLATMPQLNELHEEPRDYWRYTKFGLEELFKSTGFKIVRIDQRGGYFSSVAQIKIRYLIDRFDLMNSRVKFFMAPITQIYGRFMIWLDSIDKSRANRKHAIGWLIIART